MDWKMPWYTILDNGDGALDTTVLGRQEDWEDSPHGYPQTLPYQWWRWHDSYEPSA